MERLFMRTDASGRVGFSLKADVWMIDTVYMIEAPVI